MTSIAIHLRSSAFIGGLLLSLLAGCTEESPATSVQDDQKSALKDPFNYGPNAANMGKPGGDDFDSTNISGGGIDNYDKKGMKHDLDAVFGP